MKRMACLALGLALWLGPARAGVNDGIAAYSRGDYATALREFRSSANAGNVSAQHNLGFLYMNGRGVAQDYKKAAEWFRKAAEQGKEESQHNLGFLP